MQEFTGTYSITALIGTKKVKKVAHSVTHSRPEDEDVFTTYVTKTLISFMYFVHALNQAWRSCAMFYSNVGIYVFISVNNEDNLVGKCLHLDAFFMVHTRDVMTSRQMI